MTAQYDKLIDLTRLGAFKAEADQHYAGTSTATTSADGLMSSTDKTRLDGIASVNGIVKENGSGTASAASASDVVTLLGSTAVNRATSDASGNDIANTYATKTALNCKADVSHTHSEYQTQHTTATCSLTVAGWTNGSQTVNAAGVTASNTVIVAPAPASATAWAAAGVVCTAQAAGTLTFTCTTAPTDALTANVLVLDGGVMLYSIDNGSPSVMSVNKSYAAAGETVTVTNLTSSALSLELNGVTQTDIAANGTATFTMPAENVVVNEHVALPTHTMRYRQLDGTHTSTNGVDTTNETIEYVDGETINIVVTGSSFDWELRVDDHSSTGGTKLSSGSGSSGSTVAITMPNQDVVFVTMLD